MVDLVTEETDLPAREVDALVEVVAKLVLLIFVEPVVVRDICLLIVLQVELETHVLLVQVLSHILALHSTLVLSMAMKLLFLEIQVVTQQ